MSSKLSGFLGSELLPLYQDGEKLLTSAPAGLSDYSFVVFPFAKVYEGFLKKLFLSIGAINEWQYNNDRWRVGRALNPELEKEYRHESVYDRLVEHCGGVTLADQLWQVWKRGRNQIFHFWPGRNRALTIEDVRQIIKEIEAAMEAALVDCKL